MWIYPANPIHWSDWLNNPISALVPIARTGLMSSVDHFSALSSCKELAYYMLFCGFYEDGCKLLEATLKFQIDRGASVSKEEKLLLEVIWSSRPDLRFAEVRWEPLSAEEQELVALQTRERICTTDYFFRPRVLPQSPHDWRDSSDPAFVEECARMLSWPSGDKWPDDETTREVLEAMQKSRSLLNGERPAPSIRSYSLEVGTALRVGTEEAREVTEQILENSNDVDWHHSSNKSWMSDCLCFKNMRPVLSSLSAQVLKLSRVDAGAACRDLVEAIESRLGGDLQVPLPSVGWNELLDRLAKAAFLVYGGDEYYKEVGIANYEDILFPPATQEEIEEAEDTLGELPADFKEMVAVHNGFKGGDELLVGGCTGIKDAEVEDTFEVESWLFPRLPPDRSYVNAHGQAMNVMSFGEDGESKTDGYTIRLWSTEEFISCRQFIVPHSTWKVYGDPQAADGEYRYVHSGEIMAEWPSFRHYVGEKVIQLEAQARIREETG